MKILNLLFIVLIFSACTSPQTSEVSKTSEVSATPMPTQTPIPTPTLHPNFIALQQSISQVEGLILTNDGTIEHNGEPVPNITVTADGKYVLVVGEEMIMLSPDEVTLDPEKGVMPDGYELNENGKWVEAVSEAMQMVTGLIDQYGVDPETVTVTEKNGVASVTDNETGKVIMESDGTTTRYSLEFAVDGIAAKSCEPTPFKPSKSGLMSGESGPAASEYRSALINELKYQRNHGGSADYILINRVDQCWAIVLNNKDMLYRDGEGVAHMLHLLPITDQEVDEFKTSR